MKVKVLEAFSAKHIEEKVQEFLDAVSQEEINYHIMNYQLVVSDTSYVATFLYIAINEGENHGN